MAGGIDNINSVILPLSGDGCGYDRNAALALLLHPIGHGSAVVNRADAVCLAGVEQDPFGGSGLARINMGNDADIAGSIQ